MPPASYTPPASSGRTAYATYPIWLYGNSVQAAINAAHAAGGGTVFVPRGSWVQTATLTLYDGVTLAGEGMAAGGTELKWNTDLGAGNWGIVRGDAINIVRTGPQIRDMTLTGPFSQVIAPDAPPQSATVGMDGLQAMAIQERIQVGGFRAGITIRNDHERFIDCSIQGNYYGILYQGTAHSYGNQFFERVEMASAQFADLAIEGSNMLDGVSMRDCYFASAPYGIWKGDDPGGVASTKHAILESVFDNVGFESIGNSFIRDQSTGVGLSTFFNVDWREMGGSYDRTMKITANPVVYGFDVRSLSGRNRVSVSTNPPPAGSGTVWNITSIPGSLELWDWPGNGNPVTPTTFTVGGTDDANIIYHPPAANGCEYGSVVIPAGTASVVVQTITTSLWVGPLNSLQLQVSIDDNSSWVPTSVFLRGRMLSSTPANGYTQFQIFVTFAPTPVPAGQSFTLRWRLR